MKELLSSIARSPLKARVVPFAVFYALTLAPMLFGEESRYWFYLLKTLVAAWMLWALRDVIAEMRWALSWEAVAVGVFVFVMWVGLDHVLRPLGITEGMIRQGKAGDPWNPFLQFKDSAALAWFFVVVRTLGSSLVVPPLEEVFFRSFLYRFFQKSDFLLVPLNVLRGVPFFLTSLAFALIHHEWLAGLLCGFAYQWLVIRRNRIGDAMTAHAITNFLLALWVVGRGEWKFW